MTLNRLSNDDAIFLEKHLKPFIADAHALVDRLEKVNSGKDMIDVDVIDKMILYKALIKIRDKRSRDEGKFLSELQDRAQRDLDEDAALGADDDDDDEDIDVDILDSDNDDYEEPSQRGTSRDQSRGQSELQDYRSRLGSLSLVRDIEGSAQRATKDRSSRPSSHIPEGIGGVRFRDFTKDSDGGSSKSLLDRTRDSAMRNVGKTSNPYGSSVRDWVTSQMADYSNFDDLSNMANLSLFGRGFAKTQPTTRLQLNESSINGSLIQVESSHLGQGRNFHKNNWKITDNSTEEEDADLMEDEKEPAEFTVKQTIQAPTGTC
jgi:hypothetical protein